MAAPYRLLNVGSSCEERFLPIRWTEFDRGESVRIVVAMDPGAIAGAEGLAAARAAARAWNRAPGSSIRLAVGQVASHDLLHATKDGVNSVTFEDPGDELPGDLEVNGVLAATFTFWECGTASSHRIPGSPGPRAYGIVEANLTTQDGVWPWLQTTGAPRRNCEEILAHELGHALGLDHPCGTFGQCDRWSWDALMRGWVHEDGRGAALSVDDREAARALYPGGAPGPDGSSASCVADDSSLCLLDGCAFNGHRWVFAAGLTDVRLDLFVVDGVTGRTRSWESPGGAAVEPIVDTTAFPCQPEDA